MRNFHELVWTVWKQREGSVFFWLLNTDKAECCAVLCCVPLASHKAKVSGRERQRKMCIREKETAGMPAGSQRVAQGWGMCETERVSR